LALRFDGLLLTSVCRGFFIYRLAKYESWEELEKYPNNSIKVLFTGTKGDFQKVKKYGVGQGTIKKFY
jgi:hypothetical protein